MVSSEIIESYILEIHSRVKSIRGTCEFLLTSNYSSSSPRDFAETIIEICDYINLVLNSIARDISENSAEMKGSLVVLQYIDSIVLEIGSHLLFLDRAKTESIPWSILPALERLFKDLFPEKNLMLLSQWEYNYTVALSDFKENYFNLLYELQDYVPSSHLYDILSKNLKGPFHIICIPSIERKNILLHSIIGHEIGHLFAANYFTKERKDNFSNNIITKIDSILDKNHPHEIALIRKNLLREQLERAITIWNRGLEELLSDAVGAIIFGPSALFASFELSIQQGLDNEPSEDNDFYPPWCLRLNKILGVIERSGPFFPLKDKFFDYDNAVNRINNRFAEIKNISQMANCINLFKNNELLKVAYDEIEIQFDDAVKMLLNESPLKKYYLTSDILYKHLPHLVSRLKNNIPPNAVEESLQMRTPASLVEIINSAWFYKVGWIDNILKDKNIDEEAYKKRNTMNELTLKAIEYSDIETRYNDFAPKAKK